MVEVEEPITPLTSIGALAIPAHVACEHGSHELAILVILVIGDSTLFIKIPLVQA